MMADNYYYVKERRRREGGMEKGRRGRTNYIKKSPRGPSGEHRVIL